MAKKRTRELVEWDYEFVLGAKKEGRQVLFKLQWLGGEAQHGTEYRTYGTLDGEEALNALGGVDKLPGRRIYVRWSKTVTSLGEIWHFDPEKLKFLVVYHREEEDNEYLDLMGAEKD